MKSSALGLAASFDAAMLLFPWLPSLWVLIAFITPWFDYQHHNHSMVLLQSLVALIIITSWSFCHYSHHFCASTAISIMSLIYGKYYLHLLVFLASSLHGYYCILFVELLTIPLLSLCASVPISTFFATTFISWAFLPSSTFSCHYLPTIILICHCYHHHLTIAISCSLWPVLCSSPMPLYSLNKHLVVMFGLLASFPFPSDL